MLHRAKKICGATLRATDGTIGTVEDFYFEDGQWAVRYLLVDTGKWLSGRRVLISPMSVNGPWNMAEVPVSLTKKQVMDSPELDWQSPLTRDDESRLLNYYGYPSYWGATNGIWGPFENPAELIEAPAQTHSPVLHEAASVDPDAEQLRSTSQSTGYHIQAIDGEVGHVDDFLIGERSWRIRYLLVDTSNWIGGKSVVVASSALEGIDRSTGHLRVGVTKEGVRNSPKFEAIESALGPAETGPPFVII